MPTAVYFHRPDTVPNIAQCQSTDGCCL